MLRTIVGRMSLSDPTLMFPNERFQNYFPEIKLPEELLLAYRSCCLKIASCVIIQKILDEYMVSVSKYGVVTNGVLLDIL